MRSATGLFVVFEGGDGVGKTTQAKLLVDWLDGQSRPVVRTFEPGDSPVGREIRRLVLDVASGDVDPRAEALLYAADKAEHLRVVVWPALARDAVVVCDRYVDSMLAYQGAGRVLQRSEVEQLARWATADLRPQLTVLLDLDPSQAVHAKGALDRLESAGEAFHRRVREHFLDLAAEDPDHYLVLAARRPVPELATRIRERVAGLLQPADAHLSAQPGMVDP